MPNSDPCEAGQAGPTPGATSSEADALCRYLDWDSSFFELRIGQVVPNRIDDGTLLTILSWCSNQRIDCLYFLADINDDVTIQLAEANGFHSVDIRVTLETSLRGVDVARSTPPSIGFRPAVSYDLGALRDIARASYHQTRFYYDKQFPAHQADALYETWIEKSCTGGAEMVLVAEVERSLIGYITCHRFANGSGQIGLLGVHSDWKGKAIGRMLVQEALQWLDNAGVVDVSVVTQARNVPALRTYERCGFLTRTVQIWYHRWFDPTVMACQQE